MTDADPLAGLRGLHAPTEIQFWPPAPGWWLVAGGVMLALVVVWLGKWWRRRLSKDRKRAALRELAAIEARFRADGDAAALAVNVSMLLKRSAMTRFARQKVASLSGEAWLEFLATTGNNPAFTGGAGRILATAPYRPGVAVDPEPLLAAARGWIQQAGGQAGG
ncbi:MAG: DUF4381 domain-containing protein [Magnetococcus sp. DMHC-1]|nr:DUF4381 domain-containing protein [Magnetococcales bacterium]